MRSHPIRRPALTGMATALTLLLTSIAASAPALASSQGTHAATASGSTRWRLFRQVRRKVSTSLVSITATSRHRAWAVGASGSAGLALRWNGSHWRAMKPLPSGFLPFLVRASAPDNVWVFGNISDPYTHPEAAVWNGSAWHVVTMPPDAGDGGAVVVSPANVWYTDGPHIYHWHGAAWTTASFATADPFHDLAATRRGRVWRVRAVWVSDHYQPVAQRWTGTSWRRVWTPHPSIASIPISISIWSGHDIWIGVRRAGTHRYLVLHWNGRRWRRLRVPYWGGSVVTGAGRHRVWLSGSALWNGWSWIVGLPGISGLDLTGVPGTRAAWMVSTATGSGGLTRGQIWAHGRVS